MWCLLTEAVVLGLGCSGQLHTSFIAVLWGILVVHILCLWVITTADWEMRVFALKPCKSPLEDTLRRSSLSHSPLSPFLFPSIPFLLSLTLPLPATLPLLHPPSASLLPHAYLPSSLSTCLPLSLSFSFLPCLSSFSLCLHSLYVSQQFSPGSNWWW